MTLDLGIKTGPHWWEASTDLSTAPSLHPVIEYSKNMDKIITTFWIIQWVLVAIIIHWLT